MNGTLWLASGGALRCRTEHSLHVLPPTLALWVPQDLPHDVEGLGGGGLRRVALALEPGVIDTTAPAPCRVTLAGPLLAALADSLDSTLGERPATPRQRQLALALAAEEVQSAEPLPIGLALPRSPLLRKACEAALREGAGDCNLQALAEAANTSMRTLARCFQQELALPFSHWRLQLRLARLVALWAEGRTLSASAAAVGYTSPSALSFMVRRLIGMTPSRLLAARAGVVR